MNVEQARFNMIEQQIRPWRRMDQQVLDCLYVVKREEFVPAAYRSLAFADMEIPLGYGQTMLLPRWEACLLQELKLKTGDRVLEIGTGSGYFAALLAATTAAPVFTMERVPELAMAARQRLENAGFDRVTVIAGEGWDGWEQDQPYDAIVISGAVPEISAEVLTQLRSGGRLLAFVGTAPVMRLQRVTRQEADVFVTDLLFESVVPSLSIPHQESRDRCGFSDHRRNGSSEGI